jgi:hypothetical protein
MPDHCANNSLMKPQVLFGSSYAIYKSRLKMKTGGKYYFKKVANHCLLAECLLPYTLRSEFE